MQNMYDMAGWQEVDCDASDATLVAHPESRVGSSLTDLSGQFGEPVVFTEWDVDGTPILRNYRWPATAGRTCKHYISEAAR